MGSFTLAPIGANDATGVICSFQSRWKDAVHNNDVRVVFRKKTLMHHSPKWLYVYLGSPISAITARMPIEDKEVMPVSRALEHVSHGKISTEDLSKYAGSYDELFVIKVGEVKVAECILTSETLKAQFNFFPSPNFILLSKEGAKTIDTLARFSTVR